MGTNNTHGLKYKSIFYFKVGIRPLNNRLGGCSAKCAKAINDLSLFHHCLLYEDEIFEFSKAGYQRRYINDCTDKDKYEWLSDFQGRSDVNPNDLDRYIFLYGNFTSSDYSIFNNNCQTFVYFCLKKLSPLLAEEYSTWILEYQRKFN